MLDATELLENSLNRFTTEIDCEEFLRSVRWPDGIACPRCGGRRIGKVTTQNVHRCKSCRNKFTDKTGTVLNDSRVELEKWLAVIAVEAVHPDILTVRQVRDVLGLALNTAWRLLTLVRQTQREKEWLKRISPSPVYLPLKRTA